MTSFMLIWILLQKIEKLEKELNTYKNNTDKNWFSVQSSSSPALFFGHKKRYVSSLTYQVLLIWLATSLKLILV